MALADALRERLSRRGRTARTDCGSLGTLTVEALSPADLNALSARDDGGRALLYAACRELQREGEALRREGRVFAPDEIMNYVDAGEIAGAVRAVLALSGVSGETAAEPSDAPPDKTGEAAAGETLPDGAGDAPPDKTGESPAAGGALPEGGGAESSGDGGPAPEIRPGSVQEAGKGFRKRRRNAPEKAGKPEEIRPGPVRDAGKDFPKVRRDFVRAEPSGPAAGLVLPKAEAERPRKTGQASHETDKPDNFKNPRKVDIKSPDFVSKREAGPQNMVSAGGSPDRGRDSRTGPPGGGPEAAHETASDFRAAEPEAPHEITSDFRVTEPEAPHETESDFPVTEPEAPHEITSDFQVTEPEAPHETTSDFPATEPEAAHETESESARPPVTAEEAAQVARFLLEGLRRAMELR